MSVGVEEGSVGSGRSMEMDGRSVKISDLNDQLWIYGTLDEGYHVCRVCQQHIEFREELRKGCMGDLDLH